MVNQLFRELSSLPQIEAIALGGSRAGVHFDESSDYDVYLYCTESVDENVRRTLLAKYCSYMEIGNRFWETEDNCTLKNGIDIDILYRDLDDFCSGLSYVVEQCQPYNVHTDLRQTRSQCQRPAGPLCHPGGRPAYFRPENQ